MHITCWRPYVPADEDDDPFDECGESLWLVSSWADRPCYFWPADKSPMYLPNHHSTLGRMILSVEESLFSSWGGIPNHLAFGDSSESFFIGMSDMDGNWHHRWNGLPPDCNNAVQDFTMSSKEPSVERFRRSHSEADDDDEGVDVSGAPGSSTRTPGRLRAVTLGQGGGWVLFQEDDYQALWGGDHLPNGLLDALEYGKRNKITINVSNSPAL